MASRWIVALLTTERYDSGLYRDNKKRPILVRLCENHSLKGNIMKIAAFFAPLFFVAAAGAQTAPPTGPFEIDKAHSKVGFEISHLVVSTVEGRFDDYKGTIELKPKFEDSKVDVTVMVDSIDTANKDRNDHLKSPDFFDAKKFPEITFKSTAIKGTATGFDVTGDLKMHGVTKKVTLTGKFLGATKGMMGEQRVVFNAKGKINRKDFGLNWGKVVEAGPVVGDDVELSFKIEATPPAPAKK